MPTTDQTKPFKSYDEQIALLRERGLIITDDVYARDVLKRMNYYRFSAYSLTLRENDRFFPEVTLQDMVALYDFDQEFRSIIFKYGAVVETVARAYIAYYHARQHGPIGYLNNQNFESEQYHAVFLSTLNREISRSDEPFIVHHKRDKRGVYPLWVAVEEMTFGTLSLFYKNMLEADREGIAQEYYGRKSIYIENYLQCAVVARNIAAHGGRFYNRTRLSPAVKLPLVMRRAHVDNSSPFAYFYAIFELLPDAEKFNLIVLPPEISFVCFISVCKEDADPGAGCVTKRSNFPYKTSSQQGSTSPLRARVPVHSTLRGAGLEVGCLV